MAGLMPSLKADLDELIRIPSIAVPGFPRAPLNDAHDLIVDLLQRTGVAYVDTLALPNAPPIVYGEIPAPDGAPTVLLYSHYDVVPAGEERDWTSGPFEPTERGGAIYGRGAADSKANVMAHIGALRTWEGRPPVGITIVIDGQGELAGSALPHYCRTHPDVFRADAMLIADAGNPRPGMPALTIAARGSAVISVAVSAPASPRQAGLYSGAAPDALLALVQALASLHDDAGDVAVAGLRREEWPWGPAVSVTRIDAAPIADAVAAVPASARAELNLRVHPRQSAREAQTAVVSHLRKLAPMGITPDVCAGQVCDGFAPKTSGPAYEAAGAAMSAAWGRSPVLVGTAGSAPVAAALRSAVPDAEILLFGATDAQSNPRAPNERVLIGEFEKTIVTESKFFREFAERMGSRR